MIENFLKNKNLLKSECIFNVLNMSLKGTWEVGRKMVCVSKHIGGGIILYLVKVVGV